MFAIRSFVSSSSRAAGAAPRSMMSERLRIRSAEMAHDLKAESRRVFPLTSCVRPWITNIVFSPFNLESMMLRDCTRSCIFPSSSCLKRPPFFGMYGSIFASLVRIPNPFQGS